MREGENHDAVDPLVFVASYNRFESLAHAPKGTPAKATIHIFRLHRATGMMTLLTVDDTLENPAFFRYHPTQNIMFCCTEDIKKDNEVTAFFLSSEGILPVFVSACSSPISYQNVSPAACLSPPPSDCCFFDFTNMWTSHPFRQPKCVWQKNVVASKLHTPTHDAASVHVSTCYLTVDIAQKHLLFVNYWDSVVGTMPLTPSGMLQPVRVVNLLHPTHPSHPQTHVRFCMTVSHKLVPPTTVVAQDLGDHLANRQSEPHAHAIVLDPYLGRVAFIPDLGMDNIQQLLYDQTTGRLIPTTTLECGPAELKPHGPRYIEFHPSMNMAFVVNELSSTVSVFEFNVVIATDLEPKEDRCCLSFIQSISTIPSAFPKSLNTCGRICCDPTGRYVLVSNRGHNSIAVFQIDHKPSACGEGGYLNIVNYCHTGGRTPRHFQFDSTGTILLCANQDTDNIAVFRFDRDTGCLIWTGHQYDVPSPNFVCIRNPYTNNRKQRSCL